MLGMPQYLLQDFQQWQYPLLALLHKISLPYRKAFRSLEHSCAFRHQDDVEVTKIFRRILCIHLQDMKIIYRDTLGPRHSVHLKLLSCRMLIGHLLAACRLLFSVV